MGGDEVADDEVELARAPSSEITHDFELALEEPATVASTRARARNMNLTGPRGGEPVHYKTGAFFNAPTHHEFRTSIHRRR